MMSKAKKGVNKPAVKRLTAKQVITLAKKYLAPHQPTDYKLRVIEDGVKKDDDWWYVLVQPDREDIRSYDYYGRLAEAEISLKDSENVNVLLVPVLPG
jgi:hypothetical protein